MPLHPPRPRHATPDLRSRWPVGAPLEGRGLSRPTFERLKVERPTEIGLDEFGRRSATAGGEDLLGVPLSDLRVRERTLGEERTEKISCDDDRPEVRVIARGIAGQVSERRLKVRVRRKRPGVVLVV